MEINQAKLDNILGQLVGDLGAAATAALVVIGDKLGLYKAMMELGPVTAEELASKTKTGARYVREWLCNQAASGYVEYDSKTKTFLLPPEQALALADPSSGCFFAGGFQVIASMFQDEPKLREAFRGGKCVDWGDHCADLFEGTERFFRSSYQAHLIESWIPALDGVKEKLTRGAKVADVGCGHGASTILMAKAFPKSTFVGFDAHGASIERARQMAKNAGVGDRVKFEVATSTDFPGTNYDFVACFDCLHDMGDPEGAAAHVRESLAPDGSWMIVEPFAGDKIEDNLNPVGRVYYAASTMICVPASLAHGGPALGAQAGEEQLRKVVNAGGLSKFRRATETPFNIVFEARR